MKRTVVIGMLFLFAVCGIVSAEIWFDEDGLIHDDAWQQPPSVDEILDQMFSDMAAQQREQTREQIRNQYGEQSVERYNQIAQCHDCGGRGCCSYCNGSGVAGPDDYLGREMYDGNCAYCMGNGQCRRCYGSGQAF
ncbi:MAG: hypothetical protein HDR34_05060 [Treponema sp.]|nr:hypothetical protein [Treponema sp.]